MADVVQKLVFKRGNKSNLIAKLIDGNKPLSGEPVYETDTGKLKIGDGVHNYTDLPYINDGSSTQQVVFLNKSEFPASGLAEKIYVAKDEGKSYIWDATGSKYIYLGIGDETGNIIDGGDASD